MRVGGVDSLAGVRKVRRALVTGRRVEEKWIFIRNARRSVQLDFDNTCAKP